jgi:hypothetical protein
MNKSKVLGQAMADQMSALLNEVDERCHLGWHEAAQAAGVSIDAVMTGVAAVLLDREAFRAGVTQSDEWADYARLAMRLSLAQRAVDSIPAE